MEKFPPTVSTLTLSSLFATDPKNRLVIHEFLKTHLAKDIPGSLDVETCVKGRSTHLPDQLQAAKGTSFLSLSAEIRQMIYDYALVVGKVWP